MSIRDRRLFVMGMIAAQAEDATFEIQVRAALHKVSLRRRYSELSSSCLIMSVIQGDRMRYVTSAFWRRWRKRQNLPRITSEAARMFLAHPRCMPISACAMFRGGR